MSQNSWFDPFYIENNLSEAELAIQKNVRDFCEKELITRVVEENRNNLFDINLYESFGSLGVLGSTINEYGGAGVNQVAYGITAYEFEKIDSSYRSSISVQSSLVIHPINSFGSKDQKEEYLPDLISGKKIGCFGLTESEAGSAPSSMKTSCNETSDGYIINGSKNWITNAPIADVFIIWALDAKKEVSGFILDKDTKGLSTSFIKNKTSLKISPTGQIILDNVHVSKNKILLR